LMVMADCYLYPRPMVYQLYSASWDYQLSPRPCYHHPCLHYFLCS